MKTEITGFIILCRRPVLAVCEWPLQVLKKGSNKCVFTDFGTKKKQELLETVNTVYTLNLSI